MTHNASFYLKKGTDHHTTIEEWEDNTDILSVDKVKMYVEKGVPKNTQTSYRYDLKHFQAHGGILPAKQEDIVNYLVRFAPTLNPRTLRRRLCAISLWHTTKNLPNPTKIPLVQKVMKGIEHYHGTPTKKAAALDLKAIKTIVTHLDQQNSLKALRDKALLLLAYFGVMRRSEVSNLNMEHIEFLEEGIVVLFPKSKTDQKGEGQRCAIPVYPDEALCPVRALIAWRRASGIYEGPAFLPVTRYDTLIKQQDRRLSAGQVGRLIKQLAKDAGLTNADKVSGHSCRRGFTTSSAQKGTPLHVLQRHGRWKHPKTVMEYIEEGRQFEDNAVNALIK